jgi:hypothetical protein
VGLVKASTRISDIAARTGYYGEDPDIAASIRISRRASVVYHVGLAFLAGE